jgi:acyl-coenzyme A synthetase/AMP-(fatty) acid ligase
VTMPHSSVDPERVVAGLRAHPLVEDCAVLVRQDQTQRPALVAYVVTPTEWPSERLRSELTAMLPPGTTLDHCVGLSHLPLTPSGEIDEPALRALPVIDVSLTRRW